MDLRSAKAFTPENLVIDDVVAAPHRRIIVDVLGLEISTHIWGDTRNPPIVLVHGTKDHARSWDWTVAALVRDYCLIVPDLRGHGDSGRAPGGGYDGYDMVADMAALLSHLETMEKITPPYTLIGHSLGGNICLNLAAIFPEKISRIIAMEGLGVSQAMYEKYQASPPQENIRKWMDKRLAKIGRTEKRFTSVEEGIERLAGVHKNLSAAQARHLALHGLRKFPDGWGWKHDPLIGFYFPTVSRPEDYLRLFGTITKPILLMRGEESWASDPQKDGRLAAFQNAKLINYRGAAHWLHHDAFDDFIIDVHNFLSET